MELDQILEEEEKRVVEFRKVLSKIKQKLKESLIYKTQNPGALNILKQRLSAELYPTLLPVLQGKADLSSLKDSGLYSVFEKVLMPPLSPFLRKKMEYYLHRDCIMFPFTYDTHVINSYSDKNSLEETIFPSTQ